MGLAATCPACSSTYHPSDFRGILSTPVEKYNAISCHVSYTAEVEKHTHSPSLSGWPWTVTPYSESMITMPGSPCEFTRLYLTKYNLLSPGEVTTV